MPRVLRLIRWRLAALCLLLLVGSARAESGKEYDLGTHHELAVRIDSRWAGGRFGGYHPIRIRITNHGRQARDVTARFVSSPYGTPLPTVDRTVRVDPNATVRVSLSIPLIAGSSQGTIQLYERGSALTQLVATVTVAEPFGSGPPRVALLVINPSRASPTVDLQTYEAAVTLTAWKSGTYYGSDFRSVADEDHHVLPAESLPDQWIDYLSLDVVALSLETLGKLPPSVRSAILKWTEAGGTLLIHSVGSQPDKSKDLERLLEIPSRRLIGETWIGAPVALNAGIGDELSELRGRRYGGAAPTVDGLLSTMIDSEEADSLQQITNTWKVSPEAFSRRQLGVGTVHAFPIDPFKGHVRDWVWWFKTVPATNRDWAARMGGAPRLGRHPEFQEFLIPGMGDVPVIPFLVMISVFTILIGPVNYFVLAARKQLFLLVVTIPAFAFVTTVSLFSYATIADGFGVRSRTRSVTFLDQEHKTAVALNRVALYTGLAPSRGLSFLHETAVLPVRSADAPPAALDWTTSQHYGAGLLESRTHAQLVTMTHRSERGRLDLRPSSGGNVEVSNGLAWKLAHLVYRDNRGDLWHGSEIPAGASAELSRYSSGDATGLWNELQLLAPRTPAKYQQPEIDFFGDSRQQSPLTFRDSHLESALAGLNQFANQPLPGAAAEPRFLQPTWIALVNEPPELDQGLKTIPVQSVNVILGWGGD